MDVDEYSYIVDEGSNEVIKDCRIYPTEIMKNEFPWLYAYKVDSDINYEKTGKWMIFLPASKVNEVWDKIKSEILHGNIWNSKVSTTNMTPRQNTHAIMVHTKNYEDIDDVIKILNVLETTGIKAPESVIYYKTDAQTKAGVYKRGKQKPWIYSSDTIRSGGASNE